MPLSAYILNFRLLKQPSAFVPLLMSAAALALVPGFLTMYGVVRQDGAVRQDEGSAAHTWQLLMGFTNTDCGVFRC
jgi:hypothetical protein